MFVFYSMSESSFTWTFPAGSPAVAGFIFYLPGTLGVPFVVKSLFAQKPWRLCAFA